MATCPSSCTGSCPEIVPVTQYVTNLQLDSADVEHTRLYLAGSDFADNGDGTASYTLPSTPALAKQLSVILNGGEQGEDDSGDQSNFSLSGDVLTLNFVPDASDKIQVKYWAEA